MDEAWGSPVTASYSAASLHQFLDDPVLDVRRLAREALRLRALFENEGAPEGTAEPLTTAEFDEIESNWSKLDPDHENTDGVLVLALADEIKQLRQELHDACAEGSGGKVAVG